MPLSTRHLKDLHLPDSDHVIDEAGAAKKLLPSTRLANPRASLRWPAASRSSPSPTSKIVARSPRAGAGGVERRQGGAQALDASGSRDFWTGPGDRRSHFRDQAVAIGLRAPTIRWQFPVRPRRLATELARQWRSVEVDSCALTCPSTWRSTRYRVDRRAAGYVATRGRPDDRCDPQAPHAVLLLDEIEKAHPDLFAILLQVRITHPDRQHGVMRTSSVILIMTTNAARVICRGGTGLLRGVTEQQGDWRHRADVCLVPQPSRRRVISGRSARAKSSWWSTSTSASCVNWWPAARS